MHHNFCPVCGTKLTQKQAGDDGLVPYCENCQKYWFDSFHSCVIVLLHNEFNEVAISHQDYLSTIYATLTSGYMSPGESAEEAAMREVKEELGIDIEKPQIEGTWWYDGSGVLMIGFTAFVKKQDFTLSSEVNAAEWVSIEEAEKKLFPPKPGNASQGLLKIFKERIK